jgi:hypothetical protein
LSSTAVTRLARPILIASLVLALLTNCTSALAPAGAAADPVISSHGNNRAPQERLIALPPLDWKLIYHLNTGSTRLRDYLPNNETEPDWHNRVSFEAHQRLTDLDPIETLLREVEKSREACSGLKDYNLFSGLENNYPTSTRLLLCSNNAYSKQGEISMLKVIQGNDYLYIVRLVKRLPSFTEGEPNMAQPEIAAWSTYLSNILACDERDASHPCPTAG